jgi:hypothetical protein
MTHGMTGHGSTDGHTFLSQPKQITLELTEEKMTRGMTGSGRSRDHTEPEPRHEKFQNRT